MHVYACEVVRVCVGVRACMCEYLVEGLHGEVDAAAGTGQGNVLLRHSLHLGHDNVRLLHLPGHLGRLLLQVLQGGDDGVVVKDATLDLVEGLQEGFLQLAQTQLEFTWEVRVEIGRAHV